jgi:hypothetical protein
MSQAKPRAAKGKKKQQTRRQISKTVFDSPFQVTWPTLSVEQKTIVIETLSQYGYH